MKKINSLILLFSIPLIFVLILYVFFTFNGLYNLFQISDSEYSFFNEYEKIYELNRNVKYFDIAIEIKETNDVNIENIKGPTCH